MNQQELYKRYVEILGIIAELDLEHTLGKIDDKTFIESVKQALRKK